MSERVSFSDEELTAYLDGEASDDLRGRIAAACVTDPQLTARLTRLTAGQRELVAAFDRLLQSAPAAPAIPAPVATGARRRVFGGAAAGLVAGVALAVSVSAWMPGRDAMLSDWRQVVAAYQFLYIPQTLAGVTQDADQSARQLQHLSQVIGRDLTTVPDAAPGLAFKRGQQLGYRGRPLVQLAFVTHGGEPVALCILPLAERDAAPKQAVLAGLDAVYWTEGGFGYLLIGREDPARLNAAAADFRARLRGA